MADRRRSPRFVLLAPASAHACTLHEAIVERWDDDRAVVLVTSAVATGEEFLLRLEQPPSEPVTHNTRVISSIPDTSQGTMRYRVTLAVAATVSNPYSGPASVS